MKSHRLGLGWKSTKSESSPTVYREIASKIKARKWQQTWHYAISITTRVKIGEIEQESDQHASHRISRWLTCTMLIDSKLKRYVCITCVLKWNDERSQKLNNIGSIAKLCNIIYLVFLCEFGDIHIKVQLNKMDTIFICKTKKQSTHWIKT